MKQPDLKRHTVHARSLQCGFTLLEVLVSLVIIAVGLFGIAGLNAVAINNTSIARTRSLTVVLAESMSAAISANKAYWGGTLKTGTSTSFTPPGTVSTSGAGDTLSDQSLNGKKIDCANLATADSVCSADEMAAFDLKDWGKTVAKLLPSGSGTVACTTTSRPFVCKITISWSEKHLTARQKSGTLSSAEMVATQSYETVVQP